MILKEEQIMRETLQAKIEKMRAEKESSRIPSAQEVALMMILSSFGISSKNIKKKLLKFFYRI